MLPMLRQLLISFATLVGFMSTLNAHQVDTVEFEFQRLGGIWRLHGEMDIAYMLPETRWVPDAGPLDRKEVMKAPPKELERIRKETENTLRKYLKLTYGGKTLKWRIEFPDFDKDPFVLPPEFGGFALLTTRIVVDEQSEAGELVVHWSEKERAELIILTEDSVNGEIVSVGPGEYLTLLRSDGKENVELADVPAFRSWLWSGFRHVIPLGLDHILFIVGLFLAVLAFKPMLWQSLLFTLAHSITLAACALCWLPQWGWVEIFIAFTIAFIGVENLLKVKIGKRRYITVFVFGLVHGLGFASVFAEQVRSVPDNQLTKPLLGFNLGVELAQIAVICAAALIFAAIPKKRRKLGQTVGSILVTLAGLIWMIQRIFGVDITWGLL